MNLRDRVARFADELSRTVPQPEERARFLVVLEDFVAWAAASSGRFVLNENEHQQSVVSFRHAQSGRVAWSAYPKEKGGAKLELFARSRHAFDPSVWDEAMREVQGFSREPLKDGSTLRIPFSAMKSQATRESVKQLIRQLAEQLEARSGQSAR